MSNNRTFFKKAQKGNMSYSDIFSQVFQKHTAEETARVFIAGTSLTTPSEAQMLAGWQKPFLFARFFLADAIVAAAGYFMYAQWGNPYAFFLTMAAMALLVPVSLLLLTWEMNVPRNISLYEVLGICAIGGVLSLVATLFLEQFNSAQGAQWAPLTEEPAKLLIIYLYLNKKDRKYILNGVLVGMAVGVGFAAMETLGYNFAYTMSKGAEVGLRVARRRALLTLSGHGTWAALYGGALVMVKGNEKLSPAHLTKPPFLLNFGAAFALHYLHNLYMEGVGDIKYVILSVVAMALLLRMIKIGVNQIVTITAGLNDGRVTRAVERDESPITFPSGASAPQLEFLTGPYAGKRVDIPSGGSLTLGRVRGKCDVALPQCGKVSGRHCSFACSGATVTVTDLGASNGTTVDGKPLVPNSPVPVRAGSVVSLGGECSIRVVG